MEEIKAYLFNNTDLSDAQVDELAYEIEQRIDYSPIYDQIDKILEQFAQADDYVKSQD